MFGNALEKGKKVVKKILKWIEEEFKIVGSTFLHIIIEEVIVGQALEWAFQNIKKLKKMSKYTQEYLKYGVGALVGHIFSQTFEHSTLQEAITGQALDGIGEAFSRIHHLEEHIKLCLKGILKFLHETTYTTFKLVSAPSV